MSPPPYTPPSDGDEPGTLPASPRRRKSDYAVVSDSPWWVRAVAIIGIPGVLAIYLVYIGAQEVPSIRRAAEQTKEEVLRNREVMRDLLVQTEALSRRVNRICYNTAKTDAERDRCFD